MSLVILRNIVELTACSRPPNQRVSRTGRSSDQYRVIKFSTNLLDRLIDFCGVSYVSKFEAPRFFNRAPPRLGIDVLPIRLVGSSGVKLDELVRQDSVTTPIPPQKRSQRQSSMSGGFVLN